MRQMTLSNISSSSGNGQVRQTLSSQAASAKLRNRCITNSVKSLDLLRLNLQAAINKEIDGIIKKYLEKFFRPAVENIRNNLGESSVTEEHIRMVCRQILEDAKCQYYSSSESSRVSSPYGDTDNISVNDYKTGNCVNMNPQPLPSKRKDSDPTDSDVSCQLVVKQHKKKFVRSVSGLVTVPDRSSSSRVMKMDFWKRDGPKWDPNRIVKSTLFIMGARANKVLGFGQTRGRLYTKHPEVFKYSGDTEDKEWFSRHNLMPPTGGKAYMLVLDDIRELAESDEYRNNPNVLFQELKGFEAPDFMLTKIRAFIQNARTCSASADSFPYIPNHAEQTIKYAATSNIECVVTPPSTVLDSAPSTPGDNLDLLDCQQTDVFQHELDSYVYAQLDNGHIVNTTTTATQMLNSNLICDISRSNPYSCN